MRAKYLTKLCLLVALYVSLLEHSDTLKLLRFELTRHLEREKLLGNILDELRRGYNPNYQDMAVLEAVRGWEELAGLPHIGQEEKEEGIDEGTARSEQQSNEDSLSEKELEKKLDSLLQTDYETLLLENDKYTGAVSEETLRA
jgi:protein kinase C substrate 80K-H